MKGDRVEVVIDTGTGSAKVFEIEATKAGRRVDVTSGRGIVEVAEMTRTGQAVRVGRFMASRVIAVVEHPANETEAAEERRLAAKFPLGRPRLETNPSCTGSPPLKKTMGMTVVAALAAKAAGSVIAAITATGARTRSAAMAGSRS